MARRHSASQDSLELLLDTICNTFGGVLFIAILVVLLLQNAGHHEAEKPPESVSPEELVLRTSQLEELSAELARQREIYTSQLSLVETLVPNNVQELIDQRKELLEEQAQFQQRVDAIHAENAAMAANVERVKHDVETLKASLKAARERQTQVKALLATEQQSKVKDLKLPKLRSGGFKQEIGFIIRYGRLYLWHRYDANQKRLGLNTDDFVVITDEGDHLVTRPNPARGIPLSDGESCRQAINQLLAQFTPKHQCICAIVRPDSYGEFQHFRECIVEKGFDYRLMPVGEDSQITDRGGSGGNVQ